MQRILTARQMREADRLTIEEHGVPGMTLMENAGGRVYKLLDRRFAPLGEHHIVILCGKGNNGGDGLVVARKIAAGHAGQRLDVVLFGEPGRLRPDAAANYQALLDIDIQPTIVTDAEKWRELLPRLEGSTLVVDALLGTGMRGAAEGLYADVIGDLNTRFPRAQVVAVDMPSGMPPDTGEPAGPSVRAGHTVTFTAPKPSQVFPPNCFQAGALTVAHIGTAASVIESIPNLQLGLVEARDFASLFVPRPPASHKGDYGHLLVIGGSRAKPGAVLMAGAAALRAGAGLVTVATAAGAAGTVVAHTPELMTLPAREAADGSIDASAFEESWLDRKTVVAIGPGLGVSPENQLLTRRIIKAADVPLVIDADGLRALELGAPLRSRLGRRLTVLTPHPGEMGVLTGLSAADVQGRRVELARSFAQEYGVHLVLKGFRTLIATPDGQVLVNSTGTPAMAKAGSGDILTGMIGGFLAQFAEEEPARVIAAAVYLHGLAGELAVKDTGELGLLASDLPRYLPAAIDEVKTRDRGGTQFQPL